MSLMVQGKELTYPMFFISSNKTFSSGDDLALILPVEIF